MVDFLLFLTTDFPILLEFAKSNEIICFLFIKSLGLYLNFEKSSWKNLDLQKSISKLIFAAYTDSKNPVWNRLKIQFVQLDFSKLIFQKSTGGLEIRGSNLQFLTLWLIIEFEIMCDWVSMGTSLRQGFINDN